MTDIHELLASYPRRRPPLGAQLERIYLDEYQVNREGRFLVEHINGAQEILRVVRHFFERVRVRRFPLPHHHLSLYAYIHADRPRRDVCEQFLGQGA